MDVTPSDSRYVPLTQQPYCCVPACIQMVMVRRKIPLIPQELIGYRLGLIVPRSAAKYFWKARTGKRPKAGYGTQITDEKFDINAAFASLGIPLKVKYAPINTFQSIGDFRDYLHGMGDHDMDALAIFDYGALYGSRAHYGHTSLVDRVYPEDDEVRLVDPGIDTPKWRLVDVEKLFESMKRHGNSRGGGFWELTKGQNTVI